MSLGQVKVQSPTRVVLGEEYYYNPKDQIGEGSYAKVVKGFQIKTGKIVAVKICAKLKMDQQEKLSLEKQIHIMRHINHPNIVDFYNVYMDNKNIYLVLQYLEGGQLYDHILEKQVYSEQQAKEALLPIIDAIRYLHMTGIVHRDLKPQNLVYTQKDGVKVLKIIDFGVSQIITNQTFMSTAIGTPLYMAPEIFMGQKYKGHVDIWSIGIILYVLLCGYPPFESQNITQLQQQIKTAEIVFDQADWSQISQEAIDLVKALLERDPNKRISIQQIYEHPWIVKDAPTKNLPNTKLRLRKAIKKIITAIKVINAMKQFPGGSSLKDAMMKKKQSVQK